MPQEKPRILSVRFLLILSFLSFALAESKVHLDVRSKAEFRSGHKPGSINIPLDELPNRLKELDKNTNIIAYCEVGIRAREAVRILNNAGFSKVENGGGFEK